MFQFPVWREVEKRTRFLPESSPVPRLQRHEEKAIVSRADTAEHAVSGNRSDILYSRRLPEDCLDFVSGSSRSLQRSRLRQREICEKVALVLGRDESLRDFSSEPTGSQHGQHQKQNAKQTAPD